MTEAVKRRYNAGRRQAQARQNQQRMIDAAARLFAERGYAATSLTDVAGEAEVAVQTLYAAFGTKANLLKHAIDVTLAGDHLAVPMMERDFAQQMIAESDPRQVLAIYAAHVREVAERAGGLLLAAWAASASDPAANELITELDAQRMRGMTAAASAIAAKAIQAGCLADGITEDDIRDALWAFNSPQLYGLLLHDLGWSPDHFQTWLARAWIRLLLDPP
jgi:TetR/AcrR family transcriptional regulator, regulator of autoinduction and epiphytic fitness